MRILFQGDSITDAGRNKDDAGDLGHGYAAYVAETLSRTCPGRYSFYNRGFNGNTVGGVADRYDADIAAIRPDFVSLVVGVNDAYYDVTDALKADAARFEEQYEQLLDRIVSDFPGAGLMLGTPFLIRNMKRQDIAEYLYPPLRRAVEERSERVFAIAARRGIPCMDLQKLFDELTAGRTGDELSEDGVHPAEEGHRAIARLWIETFDECRVQRA